MKRGIEMADQNEMLKIVTPMVEHVCDHLCRFPWETERKEDLEEMCANCQMDKYTNDILNTYSLVKQEWIPVTERLPEIRESVLITLWDRTVTVGQWYGHRWGHAKAYQEDVLAWMPLPAPFH